MKEVLTTLLNEAMRLERTAYLGIDQPYQRSPARRSRANGYKPKTLDSRLGRLVLDVPQTRDGKFYPACLEKGQRSERALKLAVAEMYLRGVSTRKVHYVMEKICGLDVSSPAGASGRWTRSHTSCSTPTTRRPAPAIACSPAPSWSPSASSPTADA
jgi:transposase-like protein